MSLFMKKPRHRIFDYTPQFYKPEDDVSEKRKKKLGFRRQIKTIRAKKRSPMIWIIIAFIIVLIFLKLKGVG